jgi:hypothetical protein
MLVWGAVVPPWAPWSKTRGVSAAPPARNRDGPDCRWRTGCGPPRYRGKGKEKLAAVTDRRSPAA